MTLQEWNARQIATASRYARLYATSIDEAMLRIAARFRRKHGHLLQSAGAPGGGWAGDAFRSAPPGAVGHDLLRLLARLRSRLPGLRFGGGGGRGDGPRGPSGA